MPARVLQGIAGRGGRVVALTLLAITALAWVWLVDMARDMANMSTMMEAMTMARAARWDADAILVTFVMWVVMMIGMMLPSAAPMVLLYGTVSRKREAAGFVLGRTAMFLLGYILVWIAFSVAATTLQAELQRASLLTPMLDADSGPFSAALFVAAGIYQFTPLKRGCLDKCRSPLEFLAARWRSGASGALAMGIEHGAFCLGCCWFLMALLFAVGVMNLAWVAAITAFVLIEKVSPRGDWIAHISGIGMTGVGLALLAAA